MIRRADCHLDDEALVEINSVIHLTVGVRLIIRELAPPLSAGTPSGKWSEEVKSRRACGHELVAVAGAPRRLPFQADCAQREQELRRAVETYRERIRFYNCILALERSERKLVLFRLFKDRSVF